MDRRTKIVITVGPACSADDTVEQLIKAGVNVMRMNFSHGTYEEHAARFRLIRELSADLNHPVTILQDLQGPKIRTGMIRGGSIVLKQGDRLILTTEQVEGTEGRVSVDFEDLPANVQTGGRILLDDGNLELVVVAIDGKDVHTSVVLGGVLKPHKGVNLPGVKLNVPALTEKDRQDLAFGLELGVDAVAMSFVRSPEDIHSIRRLIGELRPDRQNNTPVIAKMERPEALENLQQIVKAADGVMVARGDLGVEMAPETVPIAQKRIIEAANRNAKTVITATQMLDSMIHNPRPTRAEATDVANAIFDGTDAVMLSGETAVGRYPVQAVETMAAIIRAAEEQLDRWGHWRGDVAECLLEENDTEGDIPDDAISITRAAAELAHDRNVAAIAVFTQTGRTARLMAKTRPNVPILAFTPEEQTYRQLPMLWGVIPYLVPYADTMEVMLEDVEQAMMSATPLQPGQQVVFISGFPVGAMRPPNMALLYTLGERKK
jgi:pyruvate kinase